MQTNRMYVLNVLNVHILRHQLGGGGSSPMFTTDEMGMCMCVYVGGGMPNDDVIISLVQRNIVVTTNFLFLRKLSLNVWKMLWNYGVTTEFKLNKSIFKADCRIITHL